MNVLGLTLQPGWLALAALAVAAGGFIRGFAGFGSALAMMPVLALVFDPRSAVAMHSVIEIPVVLRLLPDALRDAERRTVTPMVLALLAALPLGALVLKAADPDAMRVAISLGVLAMVGLVAWQDRLALLLGPRAAAWAGGIGGVVQGATGLGGPPVVAALLARGDGARTARGNVILVMSSMVAVSLAVFGALGLITREVLVAGLLGGPVCLAATAAGAAVFDRTGARSFRHFALVVLTVTALATLAAGYSGSEGARSSSAAEPSTQAAAAR